MPGSEGWHAIRMPYSSATGMTLRSQWSIRSHMVSSSAAPPSNSPSDWSSLASSNEGELGSPAAAARRRAQVPEQGDVVVDPAQFRGRRHAHRLAHAFDLAVALVTGTEEDGAGFILQRGA